MKVIKPIEVSQIATSYSSTTVNSVDIVPAWSSTTTYGESSTFNKVWVTYLGNVYESTKPNNLNNTPFISTGTSTVWWRYITSTTTDDFAAEAWSSTTTYAAGTIVRYYDSTTDYWPKYYKSLQASNLNKPPTSNLTGATPYWLDLGYSNSSKLYDIETNTQTITTDELITSFTARKATAGGVFGTSGTRVLITAKSVSNLYDSTSWITGTSLSSTTPTITGMCFSSDKNILLACGNSGFLKYSKDNGTTWTDCTIPTTLPNLKSVVYNKVNNIFVAVGTSNDLSSPIVWKSTDGITWSNVSGLPTSSVSLNKIIWIKSQSKFVVAASNGFIYTADGNGTTWTATSVGGGTTDLIDLVYNPSNGLTHVIGNQLLRYSTDLSTWTAITVTGSNLRAINIANFKISYGDTAGGYNTVTRYAYVSTTTSTGVNYINISETGLAGSWSAIPLSLTGYSNSNIPTSIDFCYTSNSWVMTCTGVVVSYSLDLLTIGPILTYQYLKTPTGFDTSRNKIYYNSATDTIFLFGNNSTLVTSAVVYFKEESLNGSLVDNWYDYFYQDYTLLSESIFQDISVYVTTEITICIAGDIVKCGIAFGGTSTDLGTTQYGASAGIIDYSKKETDEFGTTTFIKRAFSKRMNVNLMLPSNNLYKVQKTLSDIRATPCVWIGSDSETYKPLTMYGYYKDFSLEIPYPEYSYCSLQVEGLTE